MAVRCWDLRRLERFATKYADIVTAITTIDLEHYAGMKGRDGVSLLSIGYSLKDTGIADTSREEPNAICFIGSMDWPPNVKAAQYLVDEVMPRIWRSRPDTKCYLVGRDPGPELTRLASSNVVITGRVSSIDEYYERVPVVALPIQGVGGVKIKLIHALAAGKAIVSTSAGAAGLDVRNGQEMLIADRPDEFAAAVIKLLESKPERHRLGQNAKTFVKEYLSPNETCRQAKEILQRLLKG